MVLGFRVWGDSGNSHQVRFFYGFYLPSKGSDY